MPDKVELFFITDKRSAKTKSYLAVTNDRAEAERLASDIPGASGFFGKVVSMRKPRRRR